MYRDVSHPYSLAEAQSGFSPLAAIGFVHLRHEQCIKSKQAVGIGSCDISVGWKSSSPCCHPRPTGEDYTGVA